MHDLPFRAPTLGRGAVNGRVLVVDDEPGICEVLAEALRGEGYDVRLAADGHAALALLDWDRRWRPDVVLLDLLMAPGTGWQLVHAYRERWGSRAALVVMTAVGPAALRSTEALGVDDVLAKPLDLGPLLELVASHVRQRRWLRAPPSVIGETA